VENGDAEGSALVLAREDASDHWRALSLAPM
jgi:hypothetical protein